MNSPCPPDSSDERGQPDHVDRVMEQWRRERPDLDVSPQGIIGRLHRLADTLYAELDVVYREFGVGDGEFDVMATLRRAGPPYALTPTELARTTMVTSGAVTKRVDRLVKSGLVTRAASQDDRRSRKICLTSAGVDLIDRAFERHIANEHRLVALLSPSDRRTLEAALKRWGRAIEG